MSYEISDLFRRFENLIRLGTINAVDQETALVRVKSGGIITDWLPVVFGRAGKTRIWSPLDIGEQVLILSLSGDMAQAIILRGIFSDDFPAPDNSPNRSRIEFTDGAIIEYDPASHHLKFLLPSGGTTEIISDGGLSLTGNLDVDGHIVASGDVSDQKQSMAEDRDIYNSHTHSGSVPQPVASQ